MLVGLPASGKSTLSEKITNKEKNTVIISSDELRKKLLGSIDNQSENNFIFETMRLETIKALNKGINVVYDATNISSKRRLSLLKELKRNTKEVQYNCIVLVPPLVCCLYFNKIREYHQQRIVPRDVIVKMYTNFQFPMYHEGWDNIQIDLGVSSSNKEDFLAKQINKNFLDIMITGDYEVYENYLSVIEILKKCINFAQDNPYHTFSLSRHMFYVMDFLRKNITTKNNKNLIIAGALHDIGKVFTKSFKEGEKYARFYGHDNISAYLIAQLLMYSDLPQKDTIEICTYVQLHMRVLYCNNSEKGLNKLKGLIGDKYYQDLLIFREADEQAK